MADPSSDRDTAPATPRWVKVFAILTALAVVVFIILLIAGGHRPPEGGH